VQKTFYGPGSIKYMQIATKGCKLESYCRTTSFISEGIKNGVVSPRAAVRIYCSYIKMSVSMGKSMIEHGHFISDMLTQSLKVMNALYAPEDGGTKMYNFLGAVQSLMLRKVPLEHTYNTMDFARFMLLQMMVDLNNDGGQLLNSINLSNKLSLIISCLAYSLGRVNKTTENIGKGMEIAPGGSPEEYVQSGNSKAVRLAKTNNPNGTGKDMAVETLNKDLMATAEWADCQFDNNCTTIYIFTGSTPTAIQLATSAQIAGNEIISLPDSSQNRRPCAYTEMRSGNDNMSDELKMLINHIFPRGNNASTLAHTTIDQNGVRRQLGRVKLTDFPLTYYCTNQSLPLSCKEPINTLRAVNHVAPPGSIVVPLPEQERFFNSATVNKYTNRSLQSDEHYTKVRTLQVGAKHSGI
jgi:hypothetical protein